MIGSLYLFNFDNMTTATKKSFRHNINGLIAWAVTAVILYHFGIPGFGGWFAGVDIFFVISGFLMTRIIVDGLDGSRNPFSLVSFYLARARRIIPALLILCATLLTVGYFTLPAVDYRLLGSHIVASLGFFSNMKYLLEAGYFDTSSHDKWLLHTWSLSAEWQFYMVLPIALMVMWKIKPGRKAATLLLLIAFIASLASSIILTPAKPSFAFYMLPTRAWEMLAGGLVSLLANKLLLAPLHKKIIETLGFALIIGSITLLNTNDTWPGWHALIPVMGAVLVLIPAREGSLWTGNRIAQWLGSCSYSLYLWHWPIVVTLVYFARQDSVNAIAIGFILTLILGQLS